MLKTDEKSGSASSLSQKSPFITQMEDPIESLDQYGVWVKSGPEPIEEEVFEIEEENQLKDLPETSSMELTSEEEELLGSLETEERPEETLAQEESEKTGLEDIELEEEALDLDFGELPELETPEAAGWEAKKTTPEETSAPTGLEDLEDFEIEEETFQTEEEQPAATLPTAEEEVESFKMEEPVIEVEEELPELELEEPAELIQKSETLEGIETIKEEPSEPMAAEAMGEGGQEVPKEVQKEPMASRESSSIQEETPVQFNDVEAVAREMGGEATTLQMDILTKIEEELAEIKNELAELKRELSSLRPSAPLPVAEETKEIPQPTQEEEGAGFFEEDEDETIALTGDELDNILNTADITEETGEPSAVPEDLELEPLMGETAPEAMIPVTTPEEQAIIEEYNKELERFTADEIPFEAEDRIDQEAVEALPEEVLEKEDLFEVEEKPKQETFVMEKPAPETVPTLTDLVSEEATGTARPSTEEVVFEETFTQAPVSEAPISEELPGTEEGVIEFDLESLEEVEETPEEVQEEGTPKVEEPKEAFEEELEEMELSLPEEGEKGIEVEEVPVVEEAGATEVPELEEVETLPEEVPIVPLEEPIPDLHIPVEPTSTTEAPSKQPKPVVEETTKKPTLTSGMPESLREEIKAVLKYMDQLLEALPEEKIQEFARSEHFDVYRRLFEELGLE
ncbi:MAG: hypothetical protein N2442_07475 [Spirochaetes bacterium]|nr:hypothetical protein [Spirochaetota bacterium]